MVSARKKKAEFVRRGSSDSFAVLLNYQSRLEQLYNQTLCTQVRPPSVTGILLASILFQQFVKMNGSCKVDRPITDGRNLRLYFLARQALLTTQQFCGDWPWTNITVWRTNLHQKLGTLGCVFYFWKFNRDLFLRLQYILWGNQIPQVVHIRTSFYVATLSCQSFTSLLWNCWLGDGKGIRPVKGPMLVCRWWRFNWRFSRVIPAIVATICIALAQ